MLLCFLLNKQILFWWWSLTGFADEVFSGGNVTKKTVSLKRIKENILMNIFSFCFDLLFLRRHNSGCSQMNAVSRLHCHLYDANMLWCCYWIAFFCFILLTHEGSHREVYQEFQSSYDIFHRSGAKGCSDHRFHVPPAYTAQMLTSTQSQQPV